MLRISVVVPARDAGATVGEAVGSLARQTLPPGEFEVVLVDDGSSDDTVSRARDAWRRAGRPADTLRVVGFGPGAGKGLVEALSAGVKSARAPLIARHDADDIAHRDRLARQLALITSDDRLGVVGCGVRCARRDGGPLGEGFSVYEAWQNRLVTHEQIMRERFCESPLVHPSVLMRRSALEAVGGYRDPGWPEDYDLWLRFAQAGYRFAKVPGLLLTWYDRDRRLTRTDPRYSRDAFLRCKAHHLARGPLRDVRDVVLIGGRVAARLARFLREEGVGTHAFVDIDPRRLGGERSGAPVLAPEALSTLRGHLALACVGSRGAREIIVTMAEAQGFRVGESLVLCA
ncbi:MAG: glycosyltransferase [Planctomycetota bacterium]